MTHRIPKTPRAEEPPADLSPLVLLWMLRILVRLGGHRNIIGRHCFQNDEVATALGLREETDEDSKYDPRHILRQLRQMHRQAERRARSFVAPAALVENVGRLRSLVGLSECECRILEFAVLIHSERLLDDTADSLGSLSLSRCQRALAVLLDVPETQIRAALSAQGILARSGLVSVSAAGSVPLRTKLDLLSESFGDVITAPNADPLSLLRGTINPPAPARLKLEDYAWLTSTTSSAGDICFCRSLVLD